MVDRDMQRWLRLGEVLVQHSILSKVSVDRVVAMARQTHKRVGTLLEEIGLVTEEELAQALATQFGLSTVGNFARLSFPTNLLGMIPAETALQCQVFPLKLDRNRLALAVADPTRLDIARQLEKKEKVTVVPFVATRKEIRTAIYRHYLGQEENVPGKPSLLIVDDDQTLLRLLVDIFSVDYQVFSARDGREGFREAVTCRPQLILTDMEMPAMDGLSFLAAVREQAEIGSVPAILMSGRGEAQDEELAMENGFFDFIAKPFSMETIQTRVKRAIHFSRHSGRYAHH